IDVEKTVNIPGFIPGDALLYFEQRNGAEVLDRFIKSPLGKKAASLDLISTGKKIDLSSPSLETISAALHFFKKVQNDRLMHELLGKRFAAAILPPVYGLISSTVEDFVKMNSVIVSDPQHDSDLLEFLAENYGRYNENLFISSVQYGNHHIKRIQSQGETISLVNIAGHFIVSINEKQLRNCIDTYDGEQKALAQDENFVKIRQSFDRPERYLYIPIDSNRKFLSKIVTAYTGGGRDIFLKELRATEGFTGFGYGAWSSDAKVTDRIVVTYNDTEVNSYVGNYLKIEPIRSSMLSLTTAEPMFYYWSNTLDFNNFLLYAEKQKAADPHLVELMASVEKATGKSVAEIFSFLGEEVSLVMEPGPKEKYFSFPLGLVFVKVERRADLDALLQLLLQKYDIPMSQRKYGPVRYSYWKLSPQDGLRPLYGFWHNLFFFGNSSRLLEKVVDLSSEKKSLLSELRKAGNDPGLSEKNNSITYFNNVKIIEVMKNGLDLIGPIVGIEDREAAARIRTVIEEIIKPLLDGAAMYNKSVTRSYFTADRVIVDSITNVANMVPE
ncbi:MAG: hypothetical protein ACWGOX_14235, partial [Desulforhopalus sp.]